MTEEQAKKTINVPIRTLQVYHTDDGRRVEEFIKVSSCAKEVEATEEVPDFSQVPEKIYIGVIFAMTPFGEKEIKFELAGASTVEEAFGMFDKHAEETIERVQQQIQEASEKQRNGIVRAPAEALNALDNRQGNGGIIVP